MTDRELAASTAPLLIMDVDGVLNAPRPRWNSRVERQHVRTSVGEFKIAWSPALIDWLRELPKAFDVDLWWLTSWGPEVDKLETLWQLPRQHASRGIGTVLPSAQVAQAKHGFVAEVIASGRPWVWCDDEEAIAFDEPGIAPHVAIQPNPKLGLTPDDANRIEAFLLGHQQ
ncbi:hypothetical protein LO763_19485 [Glycomyces sp. A-F 0318]|uniref:HAD domain-containing protein n=1 Tax=Glycomyces amatae TaxID=2881355 RepID=UPI001E34A4E9|nr:HAD domain-containing protein [Glycomyces amatae]MCD0445794.1 hypothetical protein [Glycomyces amatae]